MVCYKAYITLGIARNPCLPRSRFGVQFFSDCLAPHQEICSLLTQYLPRSSFREMQVLAHWTNKCASSEYCLRMCTSREALGKVYLQSETELQISLENIELVFGQRHTIKEDPMKNRLIKEGLR